MIDRSLDDRLHKLRERLERMANEDAKTEMNIEHFPEELVFKFGLSLSQAKAWLRKEPNYVPADEFLQRKKDRRGLDRTE